MYSRACGYYQDFLDRGLLLTRKVLKQGFISVNLNSSLRKFNDRHHDMVNRYGISVSQITTDILHLSVSQITTDILHLSVSQITTDMLHLSVSQITTDMLHLSVSQIITDMLHLS